MAAGLDRVRGQTFEVISLTYYGVDSMINSG